MANFIFVYGTLKRGGWNNDILSECEFVGTGTARGCVLIDMGACPGMVPGRVGSPLSDNNATGEVYSVPDHLFPSLLQQLDKLENVDRMYIRVRLSVVLDNGKRLGCATYLYMLNLNDDIVVEGGDWDQHRATAITRARHGSSRAGDN